MDMVGVWIVIPSGSSFRILPSITFPFFNVILSAYRDWIPRRIKREQGIIKDKQKCLFENMIFIFLSAILLQLEPRKKHPLLTAYPVISI
jgi:hypothetical protein